ncbi:hypothetical protein HQO24_10525 [Rhodococcus fascians]|nr:hypothetical protein [Rhodococcus fascians]MBY4396885.1 hypothetical protein [Rhodococcus fascians]MBY4407364.1 hypothetical protein [Rhodococcus fascians]MBY4421507.1 hypothetical protein [Rhodococcus fascians]MBY4460740.1 hypothetical protein [Rhodococcus fascians]
MAWIVTYPAGQPPSGAYVTGTVKDAQGQSEQSIRNQLKTPIGGFGSAQNGLFGGFMGGILQALTGFVTLGEAQQYSEQQLATMNDHTRQITELQEAIGQAILQGNSIAFTSNNTYYPTTGITSIDVIILGAGGGGGGGTANGIGPGGGGGGGEVHTSIPASLLEKNIDGTFKGIPIFIGAGGEGGSNAGVGSGGGDSSFGASLITSGGGVGGGVGLFAFQVGTVGVGGPGGFGMVPGGNGGAGGIGGGVTKPASTAPEAGSDSTSSYTLNGGGGGGGGGSATGSSSSTTSLGGVGGIARGGSTPGSSGFQPTSVVATGGGGGAGSGPSTNGGAGAFPAGGGGGGHSRLNSSYSNGGIGGAGKIYVIERFT